MNHDTSMKNKNMFFVFGFSNSFLDSSIKFVNFALYASMFNMYPK